MSRLSAGSWMLLLFVVPLVTSAQAPPGTVATLGGWTDLFDGKSLTGWTQEQGARWRVSAGEIVGDAGADGWIRGDRQFADFILRMEFKNSPTGNSGLFFRTTKESNPADPSNPLGGYELQINNEDDAWATGSIENFIQRLLPVSPTPDRWHSYRLEVRGDHLVALPDGTEVLDGHDSKFKAGYTGLQHHNGNAIAFRHISTQSFK